MHNRAWWQGEVGRWEQSGRSAATFAAGKGYSPRTLTWWASRLRRTPAERVVADVELVPARIVPRPASGALWVEIGGLRVEVRPGFDRKLLRDVIDALRGER